MNSPVINKQITVSVLKDSEMDDVINFFNFIYKENRDKEKFLWEFHNAPAGKAIYIIAKDADNGKIVGTQCAIPIDLITDTGAIIRTAKSEDTLVDPQYRGLSIFENMYQLLFEKCREDNIKYIWGFTSAMKPFSRLGFKLPYSHSQSLMVFNVFSSFRFLSSLNPKNSTISLIKIFALCAVSGILSLKRFFISNNFSKKKISFTIHDKSAVENSDEKIDSGYKGFWIRQNLEFVKWRIVKNPYHTKIFNITFSIDSKIIANFIFNHYRNGIWYLMHDICSEKIPTQLRADLLKKSILLLRNQERGNVNLIRTWDFSHNESGKNEIEVRKRAGFIHIERGIYFVWKSLDEKDSLSASDFNLSRIATQGTI